MAEEASNFLGPSSSLETGPEVHYGVEALAEFQKLITNFNIPKQLFPLVGVEEFGINRGTSEWWFKLKEKYIHEFASAKQMFTYMKNVSGKIQKKKLFDIKGIKMKRVENKEMFISLSAKEIFIDDASSDKIHFKNAQGSIESFFIKAFN